MEKVKMDKVRRLLANRYGEGAKDAVLKVLGNTVGQLGTFIAEGKDLELADDAVLTVGEMELALKAIEDLVTRASKEPKVIEVADEEVNEEA